MNGDIIKGNMNALDVTAISSQGHIRTIIGGTPRGACTQTTKNRAASHATKSTGLFGICCFVCGSAPVIFNIFDRYDRPSVRGSVNAIIACDIILHRSKAVDIIGSNSVFPKRSLPRDCPFNGNVIGFITRARKKAHAGRIYICRICG